MTTDTPDATAVQAAIERCKQASSPREDDWDLLEDAQLLADACEHYRQQLAAVEKERDNAKMSSMNMFKDREKAEKQLAAALARERGLRAALEAAKRVISCNAGPDGYDWEIDGRDTGMSAPITDVINAALAEPTHPKGT